MTKPKFAIIDANALVHRAFHALPPLMTKDGILVNAVYGFANILLKVLKDIKPDYIAVCFDVARKTFRNKMYAAYKAHRERGPEELYHQFALVKELVAAFNMPIFAKQGFEADDLIGTFVKMKATKDLEKIIVTGDMDTLQLIDEQTKVYTLSKGINDTIIYDAKLVKDRYGFGPDYVLDYKALRGDPSDNIPGVKGIGQKTASDLIANFGHLENLYEKINELNKLTAEKQTAKLAAIKLKKSIFDKLIIYKKDAFLSKELATIKCDVKFDFDYPGLKIKPFDAPRVIELFQNWNFKSLISRLPQAEKIITKGQVSLFAQPITHSAVSENFVIRDGYCLLAEEKDIADFIVQLSKQKEFCLDTETDGLNPFENKLLGISFCWSAGEAYYLPISFIKNILPCLKN
jgi:DNA polymerase-1